MNTPLFNNIAGISVLSILVPLITYFGRLKEHPKQNHYIGVFIIISLTVDFITWLLQINNRSTILINNLFFILSFIPLTGFYYEILFRKRVKKTLPLLIAAFVIAIAFNVSKFSVFRPLVNLWTTTGLIIGVYSVLYLCIIPSMIIDRFLDRYLYGNVIINTALSFYFFSTLGIFLLSGFVFTHLTPDESRIFWTFHNIVNILKNLGIAIGLFLSGKRKTYITLEQLEKMGKPQISDL